MLGESYQGADLWIYMAFGNWSSARMNKRFGHIIERTAMKEEWSLYGVRVFYEDIDISDIILQDRNNVHVR